MKVDFYIFEQASEEKTRRFACQCIETAYHEQKQIFLYVDNHEEAERMDKLLWIFRDDSFLPHQLYHASDHSRAPILIGYDKSIVAHHDVVVNLSKKIPPYEQFDHVIEIIFSDIIVQQLARERYRFYRDHNCIINVQKIN